MSKEVFPKIPDAEMKKKGQSEERKSPTGQDSGGNERR
jgi:hypothetical protein